jgi:hypothetical protein
MNISAPKLENILFVDIETVPQYPKYEDMPKELQLLWDKKASHIIVNDQTPQSIYSKAGIYAEFGKIIVIAIAYIRTINKEKKLILKSIYSHDEKKILTIFNKLLDEYFSGAEKFLCAHNGKEFDFPYITRRSIINNVKVAKTLYNPGAKPWEVKFIDTLELWKFGDYKHWTSLDLLANIFGLESPKNDIDGSMVYKTYWLENDIEKIQKYCRKDVIALVNVYLKIRQLPIIEEKNIIEK